MRNRAARRKAAAAAGPGAPEPEALVVTNWFDPGSDGEPYSVTRRAPNEDMSGHFVTFGR